MNNKNVKQVEIDPKKISLDITFEGLLLFNFDKQYYEMGSLL